MRSRSPWAATSGLLALSFLLFSLGQGVEIFHPLEEDKHLSHHGHVGTVYHEPLPCDSGDHPSHCCLHTQESTALLEYRQGFTRVTLEPIPLVKRDCVVVSEFTAHAVRAPPFLS